MENFKVNLWAFFEKAKAYGCMLSYVCLMVLVCSPLWLLLAAMNVSIPIIITIIFGILCILMCLLYILECRSCINNKVDKICEECKVKKLNICNEAIKKYKSSNYKEADLQIDRIQKEIVKVSKMKKDKSSKTLLQHLKDELKHWEGIKNKNI